MKKAMNRWTCTISVALCLLLLLTGCQETPSVEEQTTGASSGSVSAESSDGAAQEGVYFQKLNETEVQYAYNELAVYAYSVLQYDGQIYTASASGIYEDTEPDALPLSSDAEELTELAAVSGDSVHWSTDASVLAAATLEGSVYQIAGYDPAFRVALYYEEQLPSGETGYRLLIFDHLNDIYLDKGSDLFEDRLHLSAASRVAGNWERQEFSAETGEYETLTTSCDLTGSDVTAAFLAALNAGAVQDAGAEDFPALDEAWPHTLTFYDACGLGAVLRVYQNGYASLENRAGDDVVVFVGEETCQAVIAAIDAA